MKFLENHPLKLLFFLPDPQRSSALEKLTMIQSWKDWMRALAIQPVLVFGCSMPESCLAAQAPSFFELRFDTQYALADSCGMVLTKQVFGKSARVMQPGAVLQENGESRYQVRQLTSASIEKIMRAAFEIQSAWLKEHFRDFVDTSNPELL